ncbi:MAG TPA: hypothetical protein VL049_05630 [Candidatus Dormibacteraeota bacterium]|nr:hypothetical protein [Candidatus Dormibacteraeota bacterium]
MGRQAGVRVVDSHCRWIDVVGRNRVQLERVQRRLALPAPLVSLSLAEHLQPSIIKVPSAVFLGTYFTTPSPRNVFERQPLHLWLAERALVTVSPWGRWRDVAGVMGEMGATRDAFIGRLLEAVATSHSDVGRQISEELAGTKRTDDPHRWHRRLCRMGYFVRLLDRQIDFLRRVGVGGARARQALSQLEGVAQLLHGAERQLKVSRRCPVCRQANGACRATYDRHRRELG